MNRKPVYANFYVDNSPVVFPSDGITDVQPAPNGEGVLITVHCAGMPSVIKAQIDAADAT